jgi:hypothetical protein
MPGSRWPVASTDDEFAGYLTGMPQHSIDLFWQFIALARACGGSHQQRPARASHPRAAAGR